MLCQEQSRKDQKKENHGLCTPAGQGCSGRVMEVENTEPSAPAPTRAAPGAAHQNQREEKENPLKLCHKEPFSRGAEGCRRALCLPGPGDAGPGLTGAGALRGCGSATAPAAPLRPDSQFTQGIQPERGFSLQARLCRRGKGHRGFFMDSPYP